MSELFYPHGGGAELATYLYAKFLSHRGFEITVVTNKFSGESEISRSEHLTIYRLPLFKNTESVKYSTLLRGGVLITSFMRKLVTSADLVYVPRFWFSIIPLAKALNRPVVTHIHDYIFICPLANLFNESAGTVCNAKKSYCAPRCIYAYERTGEKNLATTLRSVLLNSTLGLGFGKMAELSDAIICVSNAQRDILVTARECLRSKTHVVYNPLPDVSKTQSDFDNADFGYFGGPSHLKGFNVLFQAAASLTRREQLRIHATKFFNKKENYRELLRKFGILIHGKLAKDSYEKLQKQIVAVIVPSVWEEPLPYVVTEALLGGKLVIASRIGGIPEQVSGCRGAFLFDAGKYEQLAEHMLKVKSLSTDALHDLAIKNRESIRKKFDNAKIVKKFADIMENVGS